MKCLRQENVGWLKRNRKNRPFVVIYLNALKRIFEHKYKQNLFSVNNFSVDKDTKPLIKNIINRSDVGVGNLLWTLIASQVQSRVLSTSCAIFVYKKKIPEFVFIKIHFNNIISALFGILFPGREEAAFSNFRLWESVGYIIAYVISPYLRTSSKAYLLATSMLVGVLLYFVVEFQMKKEREEKEIKEPVNGLDNKAFTIAE